MRLFYWLLVMSAVCIVLSKSVFENEYTLALISSFLDDYYIHFAVLIICKNNDISITKFFMNKGVRTKLHIVDKVENELPSLLGVEKDRLAVIVEWQCVGSVQFIEEAAERKLFSRLHFWLVLATAEYTVMESNGTSALITSQEHALYTALEPLDIPLDSQVTVAFIESGNVQLQDVYRIRIEAPLIFTPRREWLPGDRFPVGPPRDNYGGITFRTTTVMFPGDTVENYLDIRFKHRNALTKFHFVLLELAAIALNFRTHVIPMESWGSPTNGTYNYDGVVGLLQRGEAEITSAGLIFKIKRLDYLDFVGGTVLYDGAFFLLKPSLSDVSNIYILPFSPGVWIMYFFAAVIISIMLYVCMKIEENWNLRNEEQTLTYGEVAVLAIALVCQEGSSRDPKRPPARIIFFCFLMLTLFLTVSYSAIIVSLLQTTSSAINTLRELMDSPFKIGMMDVISNIKYVNETSDPDVKELYYKRIFTQPFHEVFTSVEIGVEKMRTQLYAFHGDTDALRVISQTYEEFEKCRFKQIKMYTHAQMSFAVKRGSPYGEDIKRTVCWLREAGLMDREYKVWMEQKPKCIGRVDGFASVRLHDFYPVLIIWVGGFGFSILALCLEILVHKLPAKQPKNRFFKLKI